MASSSSELEFDRDLCPAKGFPPLRATWPASRKIGSIVDIISQIYQMRCVSVRSLSHCKPHTHCREFPVRSRGNPNSVCGGISLKQTGKGQMMWSEKNCEL